MSKSDEQLIAQVARDYFESWFDGDVGRMDRALHPDLVKRRAGEALAVTTKERSARRSRARRCVRPCTTR
jgi:ketosteroid isomerase-like protein